MPISIEKDLRIAAEVKKRLLEKFNIMDFRLFGSRAHGAATWDSDMDIYIEIESLTNEQRRLINEIAWEVGVEQDLVIMPVVITKDQLENSPFQATPIYQAIQQEGIII